jgi:hypothetical protein
MSVRSTIRTISAVTLGAAALLALPAASALAGTTVSPVDEVLQATSPSEEATSTSIDSPTLAQYSGDATTTVDGSGTSTTTATSTDASGSGNSTGTTSTSTCVDASTTSGGDASTTTSVDDATTTTTTSGGGTCATADATSDPTPVVDGGGELPTPVVAGGGISPDPAPLASSPTVAGGGGPVAGGGLPFTGLPLVGVFAVGLVLLLTGTGLHLRGRLRRREATAL